MSDPFAPSPDPDIPTPSREDLLPFVYGPMRDRLVAGTLDSKQTEIELRGARKLWDEEKKIEAEWQRKNATGVREFQELTRRMEAHAERIRESHRQSRERTLRERRSPIKRAVYAARAFRVRLRAALQNANLSSYTRF